MRFALGLFSLIQIGFLPGFLVLRLTQCPGGLLRTLASSIALSIVVNHALVILLTALGLYQRTSILALFAVELCLLAWLYGKSFLAFSKMPLADVIGSKFTSIFDPRSLPRGKAWVFGLGLALAAATLIYNIQQLFIANYLTIFNSWDAALSWNRWATEWYKGSIPTGTYNYPQILPTTWSLTYQFIGQPIQFFAKLVNGLFPLAVFLSVLDLALTTRRFAYLLTFFMIELLMHVYIGAAISNGYADAPVASLAFLSFYHLLLAREESRKGEDSWQKAMVIAAALAGATALVKQAGIYYALIFPLLAWHLVLRFRNDSRRQQWKQLLQWSLIVIGVAAPWYLYRQYFILFGGETSEITYVTQTIHAGKNYIERWMTAVDLLAAPIGGKENFYIASFIALALSLATRTGRWLTGSLVLPFILIFASFFSYGLRNVSLAVPFLGFSLGMGLAQLSKLRLRHVYVLAAIALVGWSGSVHWRQLEKLHSAQLRTIGVIELNAKLYEYKETHGFETSIVSNYGYLSLLPELQDIYIPNHLGQLEEVKQVLINSGARYVLLSGGAAWPVDEYMRNEVKGGRVSLVFSAGGSELYRLRQ